jgi:MFS family permease
MKLRAFIVGVPYLGWAVVYTAVCWGLFNAILGAVTPELRRELADYQQLGILMLAGSTGALLGAFQGGRLAQRHAPRRLFLSYCTVALLALGMIVTSHGFVTLTLGFFFIAIVQTAMFTLGHSILAAVQTESTVRARLLSLVDVAWSGGSLLAPSAVIVLQGYREGWRLPYEAFFVPLLAAMLLFARRRPFQARAAPSLPATTADRSAPIAYLALLRRPTMRWAAVAGVLSGFVEWGQSFWYVSYATNVQQLTPNSARVGMQAFIAGMVLARCVQAFVDSNWSLRERLWRLNLLAVAGIGLSVLWPGHGWFALYALGNFLLGLGIGVVFPILLALMIDELPAQASRLSGLLMVSFTLGAQAAGLLIGMLNDHHGLHTGYGMLLLAALGFTVAAWRLCQPSGGMPPAAGRSGRMEA